MGWMGLPCHRWGLAIHQRDEFPWGFQEPSAPTWKRAKRARLVRTRTRSGGSACFSAGSWGLGRCSTPSACLQQDYFLCTVFAKRGRIKGKFHGHAPRVHRDGSSPGNVKPCPTSRSPRLSSSKARGGDLRLGYISPTCRCLHRHLPVETVGQTHL